MRVPLDGGYLFYAVISYIVTSLIAWFVGACIGADISDGSYGVSFIVCLVIFVVSPFIGYCIYIFAASFTKCPKCGERFCIEHTDVRTITESIVTERRNGKIKKYRVGVEHIKWKCTSCGYQNEGDVEYKRVI